MVYNLKVSRVAENMRRAPVQLPKIITFLAATVLASAAWAMPQGSVIQQVQAKYPVTVMDPSGIKVATPGTILVVQLDGVMVAQKKGLSGLYFNEFKNGVIGPDTALVHGSLNARAFNPRALAVGDKVYLLKVDTSSNSITFRVQSCGTCDPKAVDPSHQPAQGEVAFKFVRGGLQGTDFNQIKQVIDQVFKLNDEVQAATDNSAQAAPAAAAPGAAPAVQPPAADPAPPPPPPDQRAAAPPTPRPADDPPPPPPPADPVKLGMGMTLDQVKALMGNPVTILDKGSAVDSKGVKVSTVIYLYKGLKVTFKNGKVADFE
jgi:hypothetical protein